MASVRRKGGPTVSAPPQLSLGIVLLAIAAVVGAGAAVLHERARPLDRDPQREVQIPAPDIEP